VPNFTAPTADAAARAHPAEPARGTRAEGMVVAVVCGWSVILPWLIGGRLWWAQALNALVGALALAMAMGERENRRWLRRSPVFWLGLAFLGWQLIQALNPWLVAKPFVPGAFAWDVDAVPNVAWLPGGIRADYFESNSWRELVYWIGPLLLACAWSAAVRRRRSAWWLWGATFGNGLLVAIVSFLSIYFPTHKILWFYVEHGLNDYVFHPWIYHIQMGAFSYANAAAVYLYLALSAGLALVMLIQSRARREGRDSGFSWVVLLGCTLLMAAMVASGSRAALVLGTFILLTGLVAMAATAVREQGFSFGRVLPSLALLVLMAIGVGTLFVKTPPKALQRLYQLPDWRHETRFLLWKTSAHMTHDRPWLGYGGGSYRYISPYYFRQEGVFLDSSYLGGLGFRANYAHNDWLQFVMEFGALGAAPLLALLLFLYGRALWRARWLGPSAGLILLGTVVVVFHACFDFPLHNAAVVTLFFLLLVSSVRLAELHAQRAARVLHAPGFSHHP
jgi:O-antigen ligase